MDVKRHVYDLCINYDDRRLALVESQLEMGDVELDQSCVRLYDIGRVRGDEDLVSGGVRGDEDLVSGGVRGDEDLVSGGDGVRRRRIGR